jgi:hypothetical protein
MKTNLIRFFSDLKLISAKNKIVLMGAVFIIFTMLTVSYIQTKGMLYSGCTSTQCVNKRAYVFILGIKICMPC